MENKLNTMTRDLKNTVANRNVYFLWSGGNDSNLLLRILRSSNFANLCNLNIVTIPFPDHVYDEAKINATKDILTKQNLNFHLLHTKENIADSVPYAKACLFCKEIRRKRFLEYYLPLQKEGDLIITGHNLADLMSYYIELCIMQLRLEKSESEDNRFLEVTNKWLKSYITNESIEIYRPLINFSQTEISKLLDDTELMQFEITITAQKCYWLNQRKRLLQDYMVNADIVSNYEKCFSLLQSNFRIPKPEEFWKLPFDTYLM